MSEEPNAVNRRSPLEGGTSRLTAPGEHTRRAVREEKAPAPAYYDVPMLKPPVWKWEITTYFYLGGLSAGAYILARLADRFGGGRYPGVTRAGTAIAAAAFAPCPLLLIRDLGDPKRFHYMLRVFKPQSPMNLGSWVLTAYGGVLTLASLNEWRQRGRKGGKAKIAPLPIKVMESAIDAIADGAGIPLALLLGGYTGVLLSSTSTPIWARNNWLGPIFISGALGTGAGAIKLALSATDAQAERSQAHKPMQQATDAAHLAEAVALGGFLASAGELAEPLTTGRLAPHFWAGAVGAGLLLPTLLDHLPARSAKTRRGLEIAGAALGLAGGFLLRWAISQAGKSSAEQPEAARTSSRADGKRE